MTASAASVLFLALAFHSLVTYPISLQLLSRRQPPLSLEPRDSARPSLAICVSAYNEQEVIAEKITCLLAMAQAYGPATVHVFADCPTDGTVGILRGFADRIDLVESDQRRGKTYGMNMLAARSDSDLIMFTDANVRSSDDAALELVRPFGDPSVGMVTAKLVYSNPGETPTSTLGATYWSIEERIKRIETRTVGLIGCDGAMFVIRRSAYEVPPAHLIDDLYLSLTVLIKGLRVVSVDHVLVFERSATGSIEEKRRKQRISCQAIKVHRFLWPQLRLMPALPLYAYISHRVLKWMMPFSLLGLAISATLLLGLAISPLAAAAVIPAAAALLYVGDRLGIHQASLAISAIISLHGVGLGVLEGAFTRKTYAVWEPAISVRSEEVEAR
ncbi:glycosyltransferase [Novosphingobium sp. NBM11]|uniref:glycosyltransferase n=1 Tax=Novosphingobium sp. NBM11 TaxID=2596914 RepID=UPI0018927E05|nr:glycosyltransferase [Novosphingobium sp. NBM11]